MMGDETPAVSVCVITYNHAPFIRDCLQSVCAQRTSFEFEVVIGEDASSDETLSICRAFAKQDDRLRLLESRSNKGMMRNFLDTLGSCRGEYVALCEGDDYWIDTQKLQRQYEFLKGHPSSSLCFHNALIEYPDGRHGVWSDQSSPKTLSVPAMFSAWLIPTASAVFRSPGSAGYPSYLQRATHGDLGLFVFLADRGDIGYIDRVMSVYRLHPGGIMSSFSGVDFSERQVQFLREMNEWFQRKYEGPIYQRIARLKMSVASAWAAQGSRRRALDELRRALEFVGWRDASLAIDIAQVLLRTLLPARLVARLQSWCAARRVGER
jgi:glycosyltransferase involved in cell wall biosynthesis